MAKKKGPKRRADYQAPGRKKPAATVEPIKPKAPPPRPSQTSRAGGSNRSWWLLGAGIAAAVAAVALIPVLFGADEDGVTDRAAWDLPALDDATDPDGDGRIRLADFQGTPLVVNFFASWCTACNAELPAFDFVAGELDGQVEMVFVNANESGNWRNMVDDTGIDDQILVKDIKGSNGNGLYRALGGTNAMPITAFYDADGVLVDVAFQAFDASSLLQTVDRLLLAP